LVWWLMCAPVSSVIDVSMHVDTVLFVYLMPIELHVYIHKYIFLARAHMTTKDIVAQDMLTHETVFKHAKFLDQLCDGLKKTMVYPPVPSTL